MTDNRWPKPLGKAAFHGVLGDIVTTIAPETEADPVAILVQLLVMFGNLIGRTPKFHVGADTHRMNLNATLVGVTSKGRKGMSRSEAHAVWTDIDDVWVSQCQANGLSSGEGLIWAIRDPIEKQRPVIVKGRVDGYQTVIEDHGIKDKRLLVTETEFASTLKVMMRDGSTLSPVCRQAWDGLDLRTLTKNAAARATAPHVSIIGHITAQELRRYLEATEAANGFGNRFLWVLVQRSRELPHGGQPVNLDEYRTRLRRAVMEARRTPTVRRDAEANRKWEQVYSPLSAGRPGMLGAMTARGEAQVMRLACLYALADEKAIVSSPHLAAALAIWRFCFDSAAWLFGDRIGDPTADTILSTLRRLYPESITRTEISALFSRNKPAAEIERALGILADGKLAKVDKDRDGSGRPVERWYCANETNEIYEVTPDEAGVGSFNSFVSSPTGPSDGRF